MTQTLPKVVADFETQLASGVSVAATTCTLSSVTDDDGNTFTNGGTYGFTVDGGNSSKEYITGIIDTSTKILSSVKSVDRRGTGTSGFARAHRVGSTVTVTDHAAIARVMNVLTGVTGFDSASPLSYDGSPSFAGANEIVTKGYVDGVVSGGTVLYDTQTITGVAGETLAVNDLVYFKEADQRWWKCDDDTAATVTSVQLAFSNGVALAAANVNLTLSGPQDGFTGLTAGSKYYASATAGAISTSTGTNSVFVGWATSTTSILFNSSPGLFSPTYNQSLFLGSVTGMIVPYAGSSAPTGFLLCDGSAVSRTTYAALYAVTGDAYGAGNGSTTFNVPYLNGATLIGKGQRVKTFTFLDADVNTGTNVITVSSNQYLYHGTPVVLSTSGVLPGGLSATTYYAIRVSATTIKLASSVYDANMGTAVDITSAAGGGTHTLTLTMTTRAVGDEGGKETDTTVGIHDHTITAKDTDTMSGGGGGSDSRPNSTADVSDQGEADPTLTTNMPPFVSVSYIIKT